MERFWDRGALFVHDLIRDMDEPKPHYNTVSTIVRSLEEKGFVGHERFGTTYRYFPLLSREEFGRMSLQNAVGKYFNRSYLSVLSMFVEEKKITPEEIKDRRSSLPGKRTILRTEYPSAPSPGCRGPACSSSRIVSECCSCW